MEREKRCPETQGQGQPRSSCPNSQIPRPTSHPGSAHQWLPTWPAHPGFGKSKWPHYNSFCYVVQTWLPSYRSPSIGIPNTSRLSEAASRHRAQIHGVTALFSPSCPGQGLDISPGLSPENGPWLPI